MERKRMMLPSLQRARTLRKRKIRYIRVERRQKKHKKQLMGQRIMHHRSMDFEPSKEF
jgi:hypothetical protein